MTTTSLLGLFSIVTGVGDFGPPRFSFVGSSVIFFALGDVSYLASQARFRKPDQGGSSQKGSPLPEKPLDLGEKDQPEYCRLVQLLGKSLSPTGHW